MQRASTVTTRAVVDPRGGIGEIISTSWPIVVSMLSWTAMGVVDTLYVGRLGTDELAGVAIAATGAMLVCGLALGTLRGVKVIVAQATGSGDAELSRVAGWQGLWLAVIFSSYVALLALFSDVFAAWMGASGTVLPHASVYFAYRCLAAPGWFVLTALTEHRQGLGDTQASMRFNVTANILNIVLDPIFIFGWGPIPAMGVAGAGLATVIGFAVAAVIVFVAFLSFGGKVVWPNSAELRRVLKVGLPMGVNWTLDILGWSFLVAMLARVGKVEVAANVVAIRIISVSFLPGHGIGESMSILVGKYVGAGQAHVARRVLRNGLIVACTVMGVLGVGFVLWPETLVALFTDDPAVIETAATLLLFGAAFQLVDAVTMCSMGALNGAGDTTFTMKVGLVATWGVLVPLGWLLGVRFGYGAPGVWCAITLEITIRAIAQMWRWRRGDWRRSAIVAD